jgi:hypothetical protein
MSSPKRWPTWFASPTGGEALGGTIRVDSPAGQGTSLQIDLPILRGDHSSS